MKTLQEIAQEWIDENGEVAVDDLMKHGCASGMVNELIYYTDTIPFFLEHQEEINARLADAMSDSGMPLSEMFPKLDKDDPLCLETNNRNLLAWFAFEDAVFEVTSWMED